MERALQDRFHEAFTLCEPEQTFQLTFKSRASGDVLIRLDQQARKIRLELTAEADSYSKILIIRETGHETDLTIEADVRRDAALHVGVLDLESAELNFHLNSRLTETGATFEIYTGQLAREEGAKRSTIKVLHQQPYTYGRIHNFAVLYDNAVYEMAATGSIEKACKGSQSHQETRVLTLGNGHKTKVLPILLIDENDVKASHAMTVGQPDQQQLYYLCSRGLSKEQAMGLLAIGYFMPVISLSDDESLRTSLQTRLEQKAGLYGH